MSDTLELGRDLNKRRQYEQKTLILKDCELLVHPGSSRQSRSIQKKSNRIVRPTSEVSAASSSTTLAMPQSLARGDRVLALRLR